MIVANVESLPFMDKSVDLVFGSPPYTDCRTYKDETNIIDLSRKTEDWIDWMLSVTKESLRVSRGAVLWVVGCPTRQRAYQPVAEGLLYAWWLRAWGDSYRPCIFHRVGIPGSGGDQWFRGDTEYVLCFKRFGPLPWANPTAFGEPPKYPPGGGMRYRNKHGERTTENLYKNRPPKKANPGNVIQCVVGGGKMGSPLAHENEAPFPEKLADFFIRSLCPPAGTVLDPFSGSGTTAKIARVSGRIGLGSDLRLSQAILTRRRMLEVENCS